MTLHTTKRLLDGVIVALLLIAGAIYAPLSAQTAIRLFGTLAAGGTKAVSVNSDGSMNVSLSGGGASSSDITITKAGAFFIANGTTTVSGLFAGLRLQEVGVTRWEIVDNSSSDFKINRYNASGVFQDQPISITGAAGVTTINNELNRSGGTTYLLGTGSNTTGFGVNTTGDVAQHTKAPNISIVSLTTTAAISGQVISNRGDADGSTITLLDNPTEGIFYDIINHAGQLITITASSGETLKYGTATCGTSLTSTAIGSTVRIQSSGTGSGATWVTMFSMGTWTCNP